MRTRELMHHKQLLLLPLLLALAGCSSLGIDGIGSSESEVMQNIGVEGVALVFLEQFPPSQLFILDDTPVELGVVVENRGAASSSPLLQLSVTKPLQFCDENEKCESQSQKEQVEELEGKTFFAVGQSKDVFFDTVYDRSSTVFDNSTIVTASVCYDYTTRLSSAVSLYLPLTTTNEYNAFNRNSSFSFQSQGAPVAVTQIVLVNGQHNSDRTKLFPYFFITLTNVGNGHVLLSEVFEKALPPDHFSTVCSEEKDEAERSSSIPEDEGENIASIILSCRYFEWFCSCLRSSASRKHFCFYGRASFFYLLASLH